MTLPKWAQEIRTRLDMGRRDPWNCNMAVLNHAPTDLARLLKALETCVAMLTNFADLEMDPKYCCWPKSDYMRRARQALVDIKNISEIEGEAK